MNLIVGKKIKKLRKEKGLSQEQVADYLHVSQSTYARIENGESHSWASYIEPISKLFEIQPEELLKQDTIHIKTIKNNGAVNNFGTVNQLSEKIIALYEAQLKEKDTVIALLQEQLAFFKLERKD